MIAGMTFYEIFAYFLVYSFIGWVVEVAYHAVTLGKVVNRGFLNGPVCPVYGVGMVLVFAVIDLAAGTSVGGIGQANAGIVFLAGMVLASTVEFIGGWGLYHIFTPDGGITGKNLLTWAATSVWNSVYTGASALFL